jgi:hypothetical protein
MTRAEQVRAFGWGILGLIFGAGVGELVVILQHLG